MGLLEAQPEGAERKSSAKWLRQLRGVLEEQTHALNQDTRQLKALRTQVGWHSGMLPFPLGAGP
jgi:hypothetical protein